MISDSVAEIFVGSGVLELGGSMDLSCSFSIGGDVITAEGNFVLSGGPGTIRLTWSDTSLSLVLSDTTGGVSLSVSGLRFEYGEYVISADLIEFGSGGKFDLSWDQSGLTVDGTGGTYLNLDDVGARH